ncbi:hypothetical protein CHU95_10880 [Niveispirillum lacus]|uniref:DUF6973 domain-containing protein n=2 Tax=Niveispirillum lacus TaxID=1981099 RepID=A0A255YZ83_9PROT|nr:hypothetical protein CHU95_10880 [Niveispirillum lacus]
MEKYRVEPLNMVNFPLDTPFLPVDSRFKLFPPPVNTLLKQVVPSIKVTTVEADMLYGLIIDDLKDGFFTSLPRMNDMQSIRDQSFDKSRKAYPAALFTPQHIPPDRLEEWYGNDGHTDAFRHAYWNALMTKRFGSDFAEKFATAHEAVPGNPPGRMSMDLFNNAVGRQIAVNNPFASDEQLADLIKAAVHNGDMVVIGKDGKPACSASVSINDHGLVPVSAASGSQ